MTVLLVTLLIAISKDHDQISFDSTFQLILSSICKLIFDIFRMKFISSCKNLFCI